MTISRDDYQIIKVKYLVEVEALVGSNKSKEDERVKRYFCADSTEKAVERFKIGLTSDGKVCREILNVGVRNENLILIKKKSDNNLNGYNLFKLNDCRNSVAKGIDEVMLFSHEHGWIRCYGLKSVKKSVHVNI